MSRVTETRVLPALREYKRRASERLGPDALLAAMALLKELGALVPGRDLLTASLEDLNAAAAQLMERGHTREELQAFNPELLAFYDAAWDAELLDLHPIRKTAREAAGAPPADDLAAPALAERGMGWAADYLAGIIQEGLQRGLMLSPFSVALADVARDGGILDDLTDRFAARWSSAARRAAWVLDAVRIGVPIAGVILAAAAWFGPDNPILRRQREATGMNTAVQKFELAMNLMVNDPDGAAASPDLATFGYRVGVPLDKEAEEFTLLRVDPRVPMLFLRQESAGRTIILHPGVIASVRNGRIRVAER
jgi:hypothetical protein